MPRTYDLDRALSENRPMVKLRGNYYLIADLPAQEALVHQRRMQATQMEIERADEELAEAIQEAREEEDPLDPEGIAEKREEIAERMQDMLSESIRLMLERPIQSEGWTEGDPEEERWKKDDEGRIVTEPIPDELADTISKNEFRYINRVVEQTEGAPVMLEPVEEGKD